MLSSPANFISPCFLLPRLMLYLHVLLFPRLMLYLRVFLLPRLVHILYLLETPVNIFHHCCQGNGLLHMVDRVPPPGDEISSPQCSTIGQHQVEHLVQGPSQEGCVQGMWVWSLHSSGARSFNKKPLMSHWSTYVLIGPLHPIGPLMSPLVHLCPHWSTSSHWSTYVPIGPLHPIGPLMSPLVHFIPLVHLCPHWSTSSHWSTYVPIGPLHPIGPLMSPLVHFIPLVHLCPHWSTSSHWSTYM